MDIPSHVGVTKLRVTEIRPEQRGEAGVFIFSLSGVFYPLWCN